MLLYWTYWWIRVDKFLDVSRQSVSAFDQLKIPHAPCNLDHLRLLWTPDKGKYEVEITSQPNKYSPIIIMHYLKNVRVDFPF